MSIEEGFTFIRILMNINISPISGGMKVHNFKELKEEGAWNLVAAFILKRKELNDEDKKLEELEIPELEVELKEAQKEHFSNFRNSIRGNHNFDEHGESAMLKSYNKIMKIEEIIKKRS